jgi:hypothetical protein
MQRIAWRGVVVLAAIACGVGLGAVVLAPDEDGICERMLGLAEAGGEDLSQAGVDEAMCREAIARRRAKMGLVRRTGYGICVVMADTLDEIGRC